MPAADPSPRRRPIGREREGSQPYRAREAATRDGQVGRIRTRRAGSAMIGRRDRPRSMCGAWVQADTVDTVADSAGRKPPRARYSVLDEAPRVSKPTDERRRPRPGRIASSGQLAQRTETEETFARAASWTEARPSVREASGVITAGKFGRRFKGKSPRIPARARSVPRADDIAATAFAAEARHPLRRRPAGPGERRDHAVERCDPECRAGEEASDAGCAKPPGFRDRPARKGGVVNAGLRTTRTSKRSRRARRRRRKASVPIHLARPSSRNRSARRHAAPASGVDDSARGPRRRAAVSNGVRRSWRSRCSGRANAASASSTSAGWAAHSRAASAMRRSSACRRARDAALAAHAAPEGLLPPGDRACRPRRGPRR